MSSKSSGDKVEPIKLETTILKIDIKTNGDLITKEFDLIPFHPNMSDIKDLSNNNYILFPSFVKITMNYLKNAGVGQDYRKVFTNLEKYIKLIKFITQEVIEIKNLDEDFTLLVDQTQYKNYAMSMVQDFTSDITSDFRAVQKYEPLTDAEIITNNIGIIKSIFLPVNGRFFVLGHEYIINESKYLPPYKASDVVNEKLSERKKVPLTYTINIELQLLDVIKNPGMGNFSKLSCQQKKINLNKDAKEIFGDTFGTKEELKAVLPPLTPTTISKRGFGKLQLEWEERNKYVKAPTTEKERLEIEGKWTPLQKKLAQYDKYQEDFNKIPPLWIKERKELEDKYTAFETKMKDYKEEIENIKKINNNEETSLVTDLINAVKDKQIETVGELLAMDDNIKYAKEIAELKISKEAGKMVVPDDLTLLKEVIQSKVNKIVQEKQNITDEKLKTAVENYDPQNPDEFLAKQIVVLGEALAIITNGKDKYPFYEMEKKQIDRKYVEPLIVDMKEKEKDVEALKAENEKLNVVIKNMNPNDYSRQTKLDERAKLQATLLKKQTDFKALESKYGENGKALISKWESALGKMQSLKQNIESDKEVGEKTILNESVQKELDGKLKEIKKLKEKIYKANYFEGIYSEITKEEIDEFSKKPGDKPIESVALLTDNIKTLEDEYLDIANKLGLASQVQGWITLLNDNLTRIKKLKGSKEKEKEKKDGETKKISSELKNIADTKKKSSHAAEISEQEKVVATLKKNSDTDKSLIEQLEVEKQKLKALEDSDRTPRENTLLEEQKKLQDKIVKFIGAIENIKEYEKKYNEEITGLKKLGKNVNKDTIETSKQKISGYKNDFITNVEKIGITSDGGGKLTRRVRSYKRHKKTKRAQSKSKSKSKSSQSLKKRRHREKKKYTIRR
jgi:hypothetical protein